MSYIICFVIIISIAIVLAEYLKTRIEITIPISVILIILIIYPFGFFEKLNFGVYTVYAITVVSIVFIIYRFIKSIKNKTQYDLVKRIITPGLFVYILFWILAIYLNKNRKFTSWDEFSHWGLIVKNMFNFDSYGTNPETIVIFRGYPPFTAIFEYLFVKVKNIYEEGSIIIAMNVLYISMMLPIFRNIEWKKELKKLILFIPFIFMLPLCMYKEFYTTIYVDAILGIFMAYVLYIYYSIKEDKIKYISIALGIIALSLIKAAGTGIAIFVLLIILIDNLYKRKINNVKMKKMIIVFIVLILCLIIGKYSWSIHLKLTNTNEAWNTSQVKFSNIVILLKGQAPAYQYTVIKEFIKNFFETPLDIAIGSLTNFNMLSLYFLYSIYTVHIVKKNNEDNIKHKNCILACFMLVVCYILYLFSLLILYIFTYSEYEALHLASYDRYSFIFLLGAFIFNSLIIMDSIKEIKSDKLNALILLIIICIITSIKSVYDITINKNETVQNAISFRNSYIEINKYKDKIAKNEKIYYISCGSSGMDYHISRYEMVPYNVTNTGSWSLGEIRYDGDIWTSNITMQEWSDILIYENYSYVYIFKSDDIFEKIYGALFENKENIKDKTLYKVNVNNSSVILSEV